MTKARVALARALDNSACPQTVGQLLEAISAQGVFPDRTTVYRELEHLQVQGLVEQFTFEDAVTRYCCRSSQHVHHVICSNCKKVEEVSFNEEALELIEARLQNDKGFANLRHSLEFYGLCRECQ